MGFSWDLWEPSNTRHCYQRWTWVLLGLSCTALEPCSGSLGLSCGSLGLSWGCLGALFNLFKLSLGFLGLSSDSLGTLSGLSWGSLGLSLGALRREGDLWRLPWDSFKARLGLSWDLREPSNTRHCYQCRTWALLGLSCTLLESCSGSLGFSCNSLGLS